MYIDLSFILYKVTILVKLVYKHLLKQQGPRLAAYLSNLALGILLEERFNFFLVSLVK